uniref:Uncharacterized protein n=1 Tax=Macaca fascicularis TaxID=9541 RepID=A0A7N9D0P6_MACFA
PMCISNLKSDFSLFERKIPNLAKKLEETLEQAKWGPNRGSLTLSSRRECSGELGFKWGFAMLARLVSNSSSTLHG